MCSVDFFEVTIDGDIHVVGTLRLGLSPAGPRWRLEGDLSHGFLPSLLNEPIGDMAAGVLLSTAPHVWLALVRDNLPHGLHLCVCCPEGGRVIEDLRARDC